MLGKATQLELNITGISRDFKRARYQKLTFVEIYIYISGFVVPATLTPLKTVDTSSRRKYIRGFRRYHSD